MANKCKSGEPIGLNSRKIHDSLTCERLDGTLRAPRHPTDNERFGSFDFGVGCVVTIQKELSKSGNIAPMNRIFTI